MHTLNSQDRVTDFIGNAFGLDGTQPQDRIEVKFQTNDKGTPAGKLADVELHFHGGLFDGLKLIGFSLWERRTGRGEFNVTFPARQYSVNGDRRSFALLRPASSVVGETRGGYQSGVEAQERVKRFIVDAWGQLKKTEA